MGRRARKVHEDPAEAELKMEGNIFQATMKKQIPILISLLIIPAGIKSIVTIFQELT